VFEQAHQVAEQIHQQTEQERTTVVRETDLVREVRDGLLHDLAPVHREFTGLLERTFTERHQAAGAGGADPKAAVPDAKVNKPAEVVERKQLTGQVTSRTGPPAHPSTVDWLSVRRVRRPALPAALGGVSLVVLGESCETRHRW
jgi:hypothetical protein